MLLLTALFLLWPYPRTSSVGTTGSADEETVIRLLDYNESFCGPFSKVGTDDFSELRLLDGAYVDKSLLIEDYLKAPKGHVLTVTRPRQFGKTINARMIKSFLEIEVDDNCTRIPDERKSNPKLFVGGTVRLNNDTMKKYRYLKVARYEYSMNHLGEWPVIYVSFRWVTGRNASEIERSIKNAIDSLYDDYRFLKRFVRADDRFLEPSEKTKLEAYVVTKVYTRERLKDSLRFLTRLFYKIFCRKVHVIVDDFDKPVNDFYESLIEQSRRNLSASCNRSETIVDILNEKFDDDELQSIVRLMRDMFTDCFRDDQVIEKVLAVGQKRYARADVLAGLDDKIREQSVVNSGELSTYYGFDQDELNWLMDFWNVTCRRNNLACYYKGYNTAGRELYNPWSIMRSLDSGGQLGNFWIDIGSPGLIDYLLDDEEVRKRLKVLIGASITTTTGMSTKIDFKKDRFYDRLFEMLTHTGYLTLINDSAWRSSTDPGKIDQQYQLVAPNRELKNIFKERIDLNSKR